MRSSCQSAMTLLAVPIATLNQGSLMPLPLTNCPPWEWAIRFTLNMIPGCTKFRSLSQVAFCSYIHSWLLFIDRFEYCVHYLSRFVCGVVWLVGFW
ncbi:hypothetical protein F4803DRAFT_331636 [Xylaria telfairii]|nr:hypothetical protein F4803DRAFT_331636 [Xylaria telfairii]